MDQTLESLSRISLKGEWRFETFFLVRGWYFDVEKRLRIGFCTLGETYFHFECDNRLVSNAREIKFQFVRGSRKSAPFQPSNVAKAYRYFMRGVKSKRAIFTFCAIRDIKNFHLRLHSNMKHWSCFIRCLERFWIIKKLNIFRKFS